MWISKKTYEDLVAEKNNLKRLSLSLIQDYNALSKTNFEMAKELEELKTKTTRKPRTTKKETTEKKTTTRKPRTKKEDK